MQRVRTSDNGKYLIRDIDFAFYKLNNLMVNGKNQAGVKKRRRNEYLLMTCPLSKLSDKYYNLMRPINWWNKQEEDGLKFSSLFL